MDNLIHHLAIHIRTLITKPWITLHMNNITWFNRSTVYAMIWILDSIMQKFTVRKHFLILMFINWSNKYTVLCVFLPKHLCCKSITSFVLDLFKSICISLGIIQSSHSHIWLNLGVILRNCCGINNVNGVSLIRTFYATESATLSNTPFSEGFIISLCIYLTEISINCFGKTSFWFDSGFKILTTSLETLDGLILVWESTHSKFSFLSRFLMLLYIERPLIAFSVKFSNMYIFDLISCPLLTKLCAALHQSLFILLIVLL